MLFCMRVSRPPAHSAPPPLPAPRTPFAQYTLLERIAVGGMAEIFAATEPRAVGEPRTLVLKRMLPALVGDPEARSMFQMEGRIGALVSHENVVAHLGAGEHDGYPYLALELVPGLDLWRLTRWLTRQGQSVGVPLALYITRCVLLGLEAVHHAKDEKGAPLQVVHRDVSPSNILLSVYGDVKLADLGIASLAGMNQGGMPARAKGKLGYLSPEQVEGREIDHRVDVFAAGVIAAELLTGKPLFSGGSELAVLLAIRDGDLHAFMEAAESLPSGLVDTIARALSVNPETRLQTAREFANLLSFFDQTPASVLRRELGELVRSATAAANGEDTGGGVTPLQPESELLSSQFTPQVDAPTTADMPTLEYRIRTTDGRQHGPWSFARAVEAVATAEVGPEDQVSIGETQFQKVRDVTSLARHVPMRSLGSIAPPAAAPVPPNLTFDLENGGFIRVLATAASNAFTGLLLCEQGGVRKEVYLREGRAEFVNSNLAGELLGEFLVANGVISRGELDMALAIMPRYEGKLGDTLAALGLVEPIHLFQHIASQVREKILDLFLWRSGRASFWQGIEAPPSGFAINLDSWSIIDEGIRRRMAQGLEVEILEAPSRTQVAMVSALENDLDVSLLPMDAQRVLAVLVTPRPIGEVRELPARRHGDVLGLVPSLVLLVHLGVVRIARDPRAD